MKNVERDGEMRTSCSPLWDHAGAGGSVCGRALSRGRGEAWWAGLGGAGPGRAGSAGCLGDARRVARGLVWTGSGRSVGVSPR